MTAGPELGRVGEWERREGASTHLSGSGQPYRGHPLQLAGGLCRSLRAWGGGAVVTVGQKEALSPHPVGFFPQQGSQILPPICPLGSKGRDRVGAGACPPPKSPAPGRASACSYGLVSSGLGALGPRGALHWRSSAHVGSPESPEGSEVTEPSRLVRQSSGGEVRKPQLDTRVRQDPPRGTVSEAGGEARGLEQASQPTTVRQVGRVRCHPLRSHLTAASLSV